MILGIGLKKICLTTETDLLHLILFKWEFRFDNQ